MADQGPTYLLREAHRGDAGSIRRLVRSAFLNPFGLDWRRFIVAVLPNGSVIGGGQLKPHRSGWTELASVFVRPDWQGLGIGSRIVAKLVENSDPPLWLTCRKELVGFYALFGFCLLTPEMDAPLLLRGVAWLGRFIQHRFPGANRPNVMLWRERQAHEDPARRSEGV
jgi:GNAT superfamily N-acetyltransferase